MVRKFVVVSLTLCLVLTFSTVVLAIEGADDAGAPVNSSVKPRKELQENFKEKRAELQQDFKDKRDQLKDKEASARAQLKEKRLEMVNRRFTYISRHLNAYLERLDKIAGKIARRIEKLKAKGVNTSGAQAKLDESGALRDVAKVAIDKAIIDAQSVTGTSDVKAATEKAASSVKEAKNALWNYHKKLVEAIRELKASRELREGTGSAEAD